MMHEWLSFRTRTGEYSTSQQVNHFSIRRIMNWGVEVGSWLTHDLPTRLSFLVAVSSVRFLLDGALFWSLRTSAGFSASSHWTLNFDFKFDFQYLRVLLAYIYLRKYKLACWTSNKAQQSSIISESFLIVIPCWGYQSAPYFLIRLLMLIITRVTRLCIWIKSWRAGYTNFE